MSTAFINSLLRLYQNSFRFKDRFKLNNYGGQALWFPVISLTVIGWIFVYSSSSVYAGQKFGDQFLFLKKQIIFTIFGISFSLFLIKIKTHIIYRLSPYIYYLSLVLTLFTTFSKFGKKVYGATRWINFGYLQFQPSELLKISSVLYISYCLTLRIGDISVIFPILLSLITLIFQPDFGSIVIILALFICILFVHGFPFRYFASAFVLIVPCLALLIFFKPYRLKRVLSFLDPFSDPLGTGFQVIQSLIAISSGGWLGKGLGGSQLKLFFLPESHTDFIFSVICEEIGYVGVLIIIVIYTLFIWTLIDLLLKIKSHYSRLVISGFLCIYCTSFLINISVTLGLVPTKGLPLPFISYGGSSLISNFIMLGILARITHDEIEVF